MIGMTRKITMLLVSVMSRGPLGLGILGLFCAIAAIVLTKTNRKVKNGFRILNMF